ncbi:uncharacterized protein EV422DRAFT_567619 [Fimicolochytrium jonesii]|uniref:uncharacterized protein n=1 Tax=Fimicolochytrium jonesii TaxID=1396493 RepID=UPI0022FDF454|nr:uncharacterized protein EV422DRAFT_567619 [Fimicolochytrium jonesii]KAI8820724.1 hypothetical protein EV422DRAFT_567619 [Fimicolochytrium jonesii]
MTDHVSSVAEEEAVVEMVTVDEERAESPEPMAKEMDSPQLMPQAQVYDEALEDETNQLLSEISATLTRPTRALSCPTISTAATDRGPSSATSSTTSGSESTPTPTATPTSATTTQNAMRLAFGRCSAAMSSKQNLELIMNQAARVRDSESDDDEYDEEELRELVKARDQQMDILNREVKQLKTTQEFLLSKLESRTNQVNELRFANKALRALNRTLLASSASFDSDGPSRSRTTSDDIIARGSADVKVVDVSPDKPNDETGEEKHDLEGCDTPDSGIGSLANSVAPSLNASPLRRRSEELDAKVERMECQQIISDLQDEIEALLLYANKLATHILSHPESHSPNASPTPMPNPLLTTLQSLRLQIPDSLRKRASLDGVFGGFWPAANNGEKSNRPSTAVGSPRLAMKVGREEVAAPSSPVSPGWFRRFGGFGEQPSSAPVEVSR